MPFLNINVCEPAGVAKALPFLAKFVLPVSSCFWFCIICYFESHFSGVMTEPYLIVSDQWKDFFVCGGV